MNNIANWLLNPPADGPRATIMIRLMLVGIKYLPATRAKKAGCVQRQ